MINTLMPTGPEPKPKRLSYDQIKAWNKFVGPSPKRDLEALHGEYVKATGDKSLALPDLRNELGLLNQKLASRATRQFNVAGEGANSGNRFPEVDYNGTNLGPVNGDERTEVSPNTGTAYPEKFLAKSVPDEVTELSWSHDRQLPFFIHPQTGDVTYTTPDIAYHPRFRKSFQEMQAKMAAQKMIDSKTSEPMAGLQSGLLPLKNKP